MTIGARDWFTLVDMITALESSGLLCVNVWIDTGGYWRADMAKGDAE